MDFVRGRQCLYPVHLARVCFVAFLKVSRPTRIGALLVGNKPGRVSFCWSMYLRFVGCVAAVDVVGLVVHGGVLGYLACPCRLGWEVHGHDAQLLARIF